MKGTVVLGGILSFAMTIPVGMASPPVIQVPHDPGGILGDVLCVGEATLDHKIQEFEIPTGPDSGFVTTGAYGNRGYFSFVGDAYDHQGHPIGSTYTMAGWLHGQHCNALWMDPPKACSGDGAREGAGCTR